MHYCFSGWHLKSESEERERETDRQTERDREGGGKIGWQYYDDTGTNVLYPTSERKTGRGGGGGDREGGAWTEAYSLESSVGIHTTMALAEAFCTRHQRERRRWKGEGWWWACWRLIVLR